MIEKMIKDARDLAKTFKRTGLPDERLKALKSALLYRRARKGMAAALARFEQRLVAEKRELSMLDRVKAAELKVHACLNYGGVFHAGGPTSKDLELAYEQGDLADEVPQMRRFAAAITELADALEAETNSSRSPA